MKASTLQELPILVASALLGATGAASAATYTLSLTQPSIGTVVESDSVSSLIFSPISRGGTFSQLLTALSPTLSLDFARGTVVSELDFTTALAPTILETFAFQDVVFSNITLGATVETVSFSFLSESTSTSATPLPTALPLFATGLGALGLLGWRRRRKACA